MNRQKLLHRVLHFFLIRIIIGLVLIGGVVGLIEWSGRLLLEYLKVRGQLQYVLIAIADSLAALFIYSFLYTRYEKRRIEELRLSALGKDAVIGFAAGLILQSLFILILYLNQAYFIVRVNPVSSLLPSLATALSAGFVGELLIRGVFFRITEEVFGTYLALIIITLLFAMVHSGSKNATVLSVSCTAIAAGMLLSAAYLFNRTLWLPVFLHFAWDFSEPGIFGAINPGNSIGQSLISSRISGDTLITGGLSGPQNSLQALIFCTLASLFFLTVAKRKGNLKEGCWMKSGVR